MPQKCYGEAELSKTPICKFYKAFKDNRESVEDKPRSGRPSTEKNINQVKEIILYNCLSSLRDIAREVHISHESVRFILVYILGVRHASARIVQKRVKFSTKIVS